MPRRKSYRKRSFKRRYKRKPKRSYGRRRVALNIIKGPSFMPDKLVNKHRFVAQTTMSFTAAARQIITITGNDIYDPISAIGHPFMGFIEMGQLYSRFNVTYSRIRITVSNVHSEPVMICLFPSIEAPGVGMTVSDCTANPYARYVVCAPAGDGGATKNIRSGMSSKKALGVSNLQSLNMWGTEATSPTTKWFWYIVAGYPVVATTTLHFSIDITANVTWVRRELIDQSI